jgi:hypothetical protein
MTKANLPAQRVAPDDDASIRINITLPVLRWEFGPIRVDPVEAFIGAKLSDILSSLMTGPCFQRPSQAGPAIEVYPLALPEGEGASVPLGHFGEMGFRNERGFLILTVPLGFSGWVRQRFGDAVVKGPVDGLSLDGSARVAHFAIRVRAGMRAAMPLGALGEIGVDIRAHERVGFLLTDKEPGHDMGRHWRKRVVLH